MSHLCVDVLPDNEDNRSQTSLESSESTSVNFPYDEDLEPMANEEEAAEYRREVDRENRGEQIFLSRFSGEVDVTDW